MDSSSLGAAQALRAGVAVLVLTAAAPIAAQTGEGEPVKDRPLRFQNLTNVDGLSQVSALAIAEDSLGFLWIGTEDGLNRYDGTGFRVFRHRPGDPAASQLEGAIQALHADRSGSLWIGMRTGGFSRFEMSTGRFTHFLQGDEESALSQYEVSCLHEDAAGDVWVGLRGGGLLRVRPGTGRVTGFRHDSGNPTSLGHDVVEAIEGAPGGLWVGTDGGLDRLDLETSSFAHYRYGSGEEPQNRVKALSADPSGILWVGTDGGGLLKLDPQAGRFHDVASGDDPRDRFIWALRGSRAGVLWIGTQRGGLLRFDPSGERFAAYRHHPDIPGSLSSNEVRSIYEDSSGNVWVGTWTQGLNRFHPDDEPFLNYRHVASDPASLSEGIVMAIFEDHSGVLWVGTTGGLNRLDATRRKFLRYSADPGDPESLQDDLVLALDEDASGNLWVGTPGVVHRLDPSRQRFTPFTFDPEAPGNQAGTGSMVLHVDRAGRVWTGNYRGLSRLDPATGALVHYRNDPQDTTSLSHDYVTSLVESRSGVLWIGTLGGLNRFDPSGSAFERYLSDPENPRSLSNDQVLHVFEDRSGVLWVGTFGGGLNRFDAATGSFVTYTVDDGLPNDVIWKILEDDLGRLWMSTTRGLARFDPRQERFTAYDPADGILDYEYNLGSGCRGSGGWMYFGSVRGIDAFRPSRFRDNPRPPRVVITSFKVFQEEVGQGVTVPYREEIELSYRENFFSFDFAAFNFRRPDKNRYAYRLDGLDKDWVQGGTRPFAGYTNVSPGQYTFRVRASNNDGVWNDEGARFRLVIHPPLWATWWAYSLYALAAVAAAGGYVWAQRRSIAREQAVVRRLREVDRLKDDFLANTSHELRTPLYGIGGLAESLLDGVRGPLPEAARGDLGMIVASSRRLASLVNDILDFSRLRRRFLDLERKAVDLHSLVDVVLTLSRPLLGDKRVELLNAVDEELPPADADENRLLQILHNLVGNAVKFTETGSVRVTAEVEGDWLVTHVTDTGIGVAGDKLESIFEAFEQADAAIDRAHGGTGLGLAVTRKLVELHGGRIWARSEGRGSTFSFRLPIASGAAEETQVTPPPVALFAAAPAGSEPAPEAAPGAVAEDGPRILIVDDEPVNRQVLANHLAHRGYRLRQATSGPEALRCLEEASFDLVLLDVMMPKMSGYEVCREVRRRFSVHELPVIFLTAKSQPSDVVTGLVAGANDYLTKPVAKDELLARVETHLGLLRIHRALAEMVEERSLRLEERERLLAERERLIGELEARNADLARINYTVSHDLKSPIVTIKSFLGLVQQDAATGDGDRLLRDLDQIRSAADQMHQLLEELYQYSRVSYEAPRLATVELGEVAREAVRLLAERIAESGAEVVIADHLPQVHGDRAQLLEVLNVVLDNALKFVEKGRRPEIEIGSRPEERVFYVRDNGRGIEPRYHEKVFGLFDRLDPEIEGTGLGLALARRIVELHGGRIWVESEGLGKGSTFCFTLP